MADVMSLAMAKAYADYIWPQTSKEIWISLERMTTVQRCRFVDFCRGILADRLLASSFDSHITEMEEIPSRWRVPQPPTTTLLEM